MLVSAQAGGAFPQCAKALALAYSDVGTMLMAEGQLQAAIPWLHKAQAAAEDEPQVGASGDRQSRTEQSRVEW